MNILKKLFGVSEDKSREMLLELILDNADVIANTENRNRVDAEYLAICTILDDLETRPNGKNSHKTIMDILSNEYFHQHNDIITYLAVKNGMIKLKPEFEEKLIKRHQRIIV